MILETVLLRSLRCPAVVLSHLDLPGPGDGRGGGALSVDIDLVTLHNKYTWIIGVRGMGM